MKDLGLFNPEINWMVAEESMQQIKKWGVQDHEPFAWLAFATEELGELSEAMSEWIYREGLAENVVKEAIQAATLCLKIAEMFLSEEDK